MCVRSAGSSLFMLMISCCCHLNQNPQRPNVCFCLLIGKGQEQSNMCACRLSHCEVIFRIKTCFSGRHSRGKQCKQGCNDAAALIMNLFVDLLQQRR